MSKKFFQTLSLGILCLGIEVASHPLHALPTCQEVSDICVDKGCKGIQEMNCPECEGIKTMIQAPELTEECGKLNKGHGKFLGCAAIITRAAQKGLCAASK